jgi:hypothetical protein
MRSHSVKATLFFVLILTLRLAAQTNPHTQIRWPANCNTANMVYTDSANTCLNAVVGPTIDPSHIIAWPSNCNSPNMVFNLSSNTCINAVVGPTIDPSQIIAWPANCHSSPTMVYNLTLNACVDTSMTIAAGTTTMLPPGAQATVTQTGTYPNFVLNFGIPAGTPGGSLSYPGVVSDNANGLAVAGNVTVSNPSLPIAGSGVDSVIVTTVGAGLTSGTYTAVANYGGAVISYNVTSGTLWPFITVVRPGSGYTSPPTFPMPTGTTQPTVQVMLGSTTPAYRVVHIGDSLTVGTGGLSDTPIPSIVSAKTGLQTLNHGIWGATAAQMAAATGALPTTMTIPGGTIPACAALPCSIATGVTVSFTTGYEPVGSLSGAQPLAGTAGTVVNGGTSVHGLVTRVSSTVFTFTPSEVGSSVSMSTGTFTADDLYKDSVRINWAGRNELSNGGTSNATFYANIDALMAWRASSNTARLLLGVTDTMGEPPGSPNGILRQTWNTRNAALYGNCLTPYTAGCQFLDVNAMLIANADLTNSVDVADVARGVVPASMHNPLAVGTLNGAIPVDTCSVTPIVIATTGLVVQAGEIMVISDGAQSEEIYISAISGGTTITGCTRNYNSAAGGPWTHANGLGVTVYDWMHLGPLAQNMIATWLSSWVIAHNTSVQTVGNNVPRTFNETLKARVIQGFNPVFDNLASSHARMIETGGTLSAVPIWQFQQDTEVLGKLSLIGQNAAFNIFVPGQSTYGKISFSSGTMQIGTDIPFGSSPGAIVLQPTIANGLTLGQPGKGLWAVVMQYNAQGIQWYNTAGTVSTALRAIQPTQINTISVPNATGTLALDKVNECGTTTICANAIQSNPVLQWGTVTLSGGTATVGSLQSYTSISTFGCLSNDTTAANYSKCVPASATSITCTGTTTDAIFYSCIGH